MEEEKLRELISVQELLDDEDEEAFNVCTKEGKDIMMLHVYVSLKTNYWIYIYMYKYEHVLDIFEVLTCRCTCTYMYVLYSTCNNVDDIFSNEFV